MMKKFVAFAGDIYYPAGGWGDLLGAYKTLGKAVRAAEEYAGYDPGQRWWHITDIDEGQIVESYWPSDN